MVINAGHCAIFASTPEDTELLTSFAYFRGKWKVGQSFIYSDLARLFRDAELGKFQVVIFKSVAAISHDIVMVGMTLERMWNRGIRVLIYEGGLDSETADSLKDHIAKAIRQSEYYKR